mgnify:CR=1 FL=1|tara:strand:- start:5735 stop:6361 length:627 start_codon:yes stop_codon:yes gene_type:complete
MLGVIVPARNEEKNIAKVLDNLIECNINKENIYVIDNQSSDQTSQITKAMGIQAIMCNEIGYQAALKRGFQELSKRKYRKFLIIDGDNEIGIASIQKCLAQHNTHKIIIGYRLKIKRIAERIVNQYFKYKYGICDLMCGVKCGDMELYNENNYLEFGIDFFKFDRIDKKDIYNFPIDLNSREETRLGNPIIVNINLIINLMKFLIQKK